MSNPFSSANGPRQFPATPRQLEFLLALVTERAELEGVELTDSVRDWVASSTKANVSRRIDLAKARNRELRAEARNTARDQERVADRPATELEDGIYHLVADNGITVRIIKVIHAVNGSGNQYAKELDTTTGEWNYAPGLVKKLTPADMLSLDKAKEYGHLYGMCVRCGRTLTDEGSISAGIGPVCATKF